MVRLLLAKGADPNVMGSWGTPLHYACCYDNLGATEALLEAGADLNIRVDSGNGDSMSVLETAAGNSSADVVRLLIERGADVSVAGPLGFTPLHHAASAKSADVANVLIEAGAGVDVRNADNATPLHIAAEFVKLAMVRTFLDHGANVNGRCRSAQTPLHRAIWGAWKNPSCRPEAASVVDLLLRLGADETLVDDHGGTAGDLANKELGEENLLFEVVLVRIRELLANAPADKAWRRRGMWALCRAHPDRLQQDLPRPDNTRMHGSKKLSTRGSPGGVIVRAGVDLQSNGGSWADAAVWLLQLGEEAIFRTIVGYL